MTPSIRMVSVPVDLPLKLIDTLKPLAVVAEKLKHCHVVEVCEPTADNPSRNIIPMPREWFERAADDLEAIAVLMHGAGVLSEGQASTLTGLDRVEVRKQADALTAAPVREEGGAVDGPEDDELPGDFLARVGMDGALWADGFRKMALKLGYSDMDEGWLIGWFCNAVMAGYDHAQRRFDPALATREEAPAEVGDEGPCTCCDDTGWTIQTEQACSCIAGDQYRAQPPAREDGGDRPIEASWTDGVTHAYVNLSAALSAERQAWRQKLGLRIASVRYLDVEVPPAREDAQPVAWRAVWRDGTVYGEPKNWPPPDGASTYHGLMSRTIQPLYTHPAPDALRLAAEAFGVITDLSVNLRQGGPDSSDLNDLSDALNTAVDVAHEALAALQQGGV